MMCERTHAHEWKTTRRGTFADMRVIFCRCACGAIGFRRPNHATVYTWEMSP